ncbi:MAG TPA: quinol:cytochrome C oxidoreductase [Edaphocola sp.]|nr:quinol:cytochrome C oxidoreductase [Edaphocola sp.]
MTDRFEVPASLKKTGLILTIIGILTVIGGGIAFLGGKTDGGIVRFWMGLMHNSIYFLIIAVSSIFIQAAASLAQGGWIVAYKRVPEAIGANVWVFGVLTLLILIAVVFGLGDHNPIYHWVNPHGDKILEGKSTFLNKWMFLGFSVVTIGLWGYFGKKFRSLSIEQQNSPKNSTKLYWGAITVSGAFMVVYGLSMMSTTPWFWIMSIDAHWFSTLFSWHVFAGAFVAGMSLILLWTVYLKNQGNLILVNKEHIHDLGKLMFAFSIFWTYTWFSQYMLIWYGNIPEETVYYNVRQNGAYSLPFYLNLVINFVGPILILMSRPSKRNFFTVIFMAIIIIFGQWLNLYLLMYPGPTGNNWSMGWYEFGLFIGFAGIMITTVSKTLASEDLIPHNHILLKESIVHLS